ncbi:MAG TPA: glycosyltransferase family 9 protein [Gemmatimonadaceae bacterium]|nr:glycosyltransferase family 9 protein [Gemmatimonadaceae bacterium]
MTATRAEPRRGARGIALDRIGIVMMSAIGDAVHVLPVVTALKRHSPASHISWVLAPGPASLVRGHPDVDEIILFDKKRGVAGLRAVGAELARRPFSLVIDLQVYFKAGLVTALTRAPVKLGFDRARARDLNWLVTTHRIPPHAPQHVQDQYFEFLDYLEVPHEPVRWKLGPWEHEREWQRDFFARIDRPVATLVIATSHPQKDWLPERWAAVSDALYEKHGLQPVLAGGRSPHELEIERAILAHARHRPLSTLGIPLRQLVALLDGSALVISLDTGPLHMAVALDRPVISLMGYNNPKRVGPYRKFHDLLIDAYGDPGEDYPISLAHRLDRMQRITVEEVMGRVGVWEERYRREC